MSLCCRLEMEQESLVSGVWHDLLSYLMNDWWLVQLLQLNAFCFISDTPWFAWHCTHTGVSNFSRLYTVTKCTYTVVLVPPCGTLFSLVLFFYFNMNSLSSHLFTLQDVNCFIYLHKADHWWAVLIFSFLRIAGQTRGSPVSQRAAEHRNRTLWFSDNNTQQTPLFASKTQQHFIWLISGTRNPPVTCLSRDDDAQKIKPPSTQMNPCPDRPLLLLWWALDFALLPLPARFTWIPPLIAIVSIGDTWQRHCVLCPYFWWIQHLVIYFRLSGKEKRLILKGTRLLGTKEMDQGEANVCIWQDTNRAK